MIEARVALQKPSEKSSTRSVRPVKELGAKTGLVLKMEIHFYVHLDSNRNAIFCAWFETPILQALDCSFVPALTRGMNNFDFTHQPCLINNRTQSDHSLDVRGVVGIRGHWAC